MTLNDIKMYNYLKNNDGILANQVDAVYALTLETINSISRSYGNYTMHDMNHGLRVASYMEQLAFGIDETFNTKIASFNAFEITLMLLSAILHDIGMTIRPQDIIDIKNNNIKHTDTLTFDGVMSVLNDEEEAIKEIVRHTHASRIEEFMNHDFGGRTIESILLVENSYSYSDDIIEICKAHGEDHSFLERIRNESTKGHYTYNAQYIAALLRIADSLDIDKQRTPILWYSIMGIDGFSKEEWETHFIIQNNTKLKKYTDNKLQIYFDGRSANAKIHRKYLRYIDQLKIELENSDDLLNKKNSNEKYRFNICTKIEDRVKTEGFKYSDLRLNLDYSAITELLMGKNIYGNNQLGLRELVQNSIDACKLMREIYKENPFDLITAPLVSIIYSKDKQFVKVKDTGIGMTLEIVKNHFLNIGKSYYKSNEFLFKNHEYKPIGQYGIGFLSCFLLSDNVTVKTKYYLNNEINQIELEKNSEYVVTNTQETGFFVGTEITLDYNTFFSVFNNQDQLLTFLETYFYTDIPIILRDDDSGKQIEIKNSCERECNNFLQKERSNSKYISFLCSNHSNYFEGKLIIKKAKKISSPTFCEIINGKSYYYDSDTKQFCKVSDSRQINEGVYSIYEYSEHLPEDDYLKIKSSKRDSEKLYKAIISLARKTNKTVYLFVKNVNLNEVFPNKYTGYTSISIGNPIIDILKNSNLPLYEELLVRYRIYETVFVSGGKYLRLYPCVLIGDKSDYYWLDEDQDDMLTSRFYNKGILVHTPNHLFFSTVHNHNFIQGYVNTDKLALKLDVSRNKIIEGGHIMKSEFQKMIFEFEKTLIENESICNFLDTMINYKDAI